jgi:hypothetical protein
MLSPAKKVHIAYTSLYILTIYSVALSTVKVGAKHQSINQLLL